MHIAADGLLLIVFSCLSNGKKQGTAHNRHKVFSDTDFQTTSGMSSSYPGDRGKTTGCELLNPASLSVTHSP